MEKHLENPEKGVYSFVGTVEGRVVGWCTAGVSRDEDFVKEIGELYGIYVHPDFMGYGVGSKMMTYALIQLKKDGYKKATLWVLDTNEKTRKWYEMKDWRVEGSQKVVDHSGGFKLHEIRYIIDF